MGVWGLYAKASTSLPTDRFGCITSRTRRCKADSVARVACRRSHKRLPVGWDCNGRRNLVTTPVLLRTTRDWRIGR